jgi:hypothetical protein
MILLLCSIDAPFFPPPFFYQYFPNWSRGSAWAISLEHLIVGKFET